MGTETPLPGIGWHELITFAAMVGVFAFAAFRLRWPIGPAMGLGAVTGAIVGGYLFPLNHLIRFLIEGMFAYFDPILIIASATIFMFVVEKNGLLGTVARWVVLTFHHRPVILLSAITLIIMFPGMVTGSSTAAVLTTGALMAPVLIHMGVPRDKAGGIIAMAALLGMTAPPVNIPALIIGAGVDLPYIGLDLPLLVMTLPLAIGITLALGHKHCLHVQIAAVRDDLPASAYPAHGLKLYLPLLVLVSLLLAERTFPRHVQLGLPLTFILSALSGCFTGNRFPIFATAQQAMKTAMPLLGILMGVGMFIQIMTLTGARGEVVIQTLQVPRGWLGLYPIIGTTMPLFGAVSSFGAASVLGVPFILALPTGAVEIVISAAALSMIIAVGDLMPPTALAGLFAAQVVGEKRYIRVLRWCILPGLAIVFVGLLFIQFAEPLGRWLVFFHTGAEVPY